MRKTCGFMFPWRFRKECHRLKDAGKTPYLYNLYGEHRYVHNIGRAGISGDMFHAATPWLFVSLFYRLSRTLEQQLEEDARTEKSYGARWTAEYLHYAQEVAARSESNKSE